MRTYHKKLRGFLEGVESYISLNDNIINPFKVELIKFQLVII